jgi:hypothetical protein
VGKACKRVNRVPILCIHECKWKKDTVETIPGMGAGMIKENDGGGVNSSVIYCKNLL